VRLHVEGHEGQDGAGLEYESVGALGSLLMLTDLDIVEQAASLCNVLGLDTISTSGTLATVIEARELGLVTAADTDGIDLVWGNGAAVLAMIPRIARWQGFGTRLADGSRKVAMVKAAQDLMGLFDSLKFCKFAIYGGLNLTQMGQFLTAVTGRRLDTDELMEIGECTYTYKCLLATRMGISRADDTLPERLLSTDRGGSVKRHLAWLDADVLNEYYDLRGWDRLGIPTVKTVKRLSIDQLSTVDPAPEG
jgi:aldehyde:ferredoxin oxidoreductase